MDDRGKACPDAREVQFCEWVSKRTNVVQPMHANENATVWETFKISDVRRTLTYAVGAHLDCVEANLHPGEVLRNETQN